MNGREEARQAVRGAMCFGGCVAVFTGAVLTLGWVAAEYGTLAAALPLLGIGAALLWAGLRGWRA